MAGADYRRCDVCNAKAFYDANLNYEFAPDEEQPRVAGEAYALGYLGAWKVLCTDCARTHEILVRQKREDG